MAESEVATFYGIYSGKAVVISNIPIAMASAMCSAIIPTVAASFARGEKKETRRNVKKAVKVTMLIAIPCAVGLGVLARPVTQLLFWQKNSLDTASNVLAALSVTVIFYCLSTLTNGALQGIGKVTVPVIHAAIALVLQTGTLALLLYFTDFNLYALVIAAIVYSLSMCVMNQLAVRKYLKYKQEMFRTFWLPLVSAAIMGAVAWLVYQGVSLLAGFALAEGSYLRNLIAAGAAILVAVIVYAFCVIRFKAVTKEELLAMPKGTAIVRVAQKLHLL